MKTKLLIIACVITVSGCAQTRLESLSQVKGLEFTHTQGGSEVIDKYTVTKPAPNGSNSIATCAALEISNKSVSLIDGSKSFIGAYSGNYYNRGNNISVTGGETIQHADQNSAVVTGVGQYNTAFVNRYVRYTALIKKDGNNINYTFNRIEQAQQDTGALTNPGFYEVGTWNMADPDKVLAFLDNEVAKVQKCLASN